MQRSFIICDPDKCLGCQICEFVCSAVKEKSIDPLLSRIRVVNLEPTGSMAIACVLCEDPMCIKSCPLNALARSEENGVIMVDESRCTGCGWCLNACPFGAIAFNPTKKAMVICDLCDGDPECIKYCPVEGALTFATVDEITDKYRRETFKKLLHACKEQASEV